jgi:DNA-binding transcriptional LysR family regulator
MSEAARQMGCSQPALTGSIRALEEEFGAQLLIRTSRGVQLTEAGTVVLELAEAMELRMEQARESIAQLAGGEVGKFVIGCHPSLGSYFLPDFLRAFTARYPRVEIALWNGSSDSVLQKVRAREVDFGLVVNPTPYDELVVVPLFHDRVMFFAQSSCESLAAAHDALRERALIYMDRMPQALEMLTGLEAEGIRPPRLIPCGEHELVRSLVQGGLGFGILPWRVATMGAHGLHAMHLDLPSASDWIALCWRADRPRTHASTCLKDALVQAGRKIGDVL